MNQTGKTWVKHGQIVSTRANPAQIFPDGAGPNKTKLGQTRLKGAKRSQTEPNAAKWGKKEPNRPTRANLGKPGLSGANGAKWDQTGGTGVN